jgi:hypothetical protein
MGTMTFGIGTESNNAFGAATVITLDANNHFTTVFDGQSLTSSVVASGSDAIFFPDLLPMCSVHTDFYCPASTANLSATMQAANSGSYMVNFSVDNADALFSSNGQDAVLGTLGRPVLNSSSCQGSTPCDFVWGLPFFYGRTVYEAIDGQSPIFGTPNGPWWAF